MVLFQRPGHLGRLLRRLKGSFLQMDKRLLMLCSGTVVVLCCVVCWGCGAPGSCGGWQYLLVSGPMKGLVISCTVALEANIIPTLTFSLVSRLVDPGQVEFPGGSVPGRRAGTGPAGPGPVVALEPTDFTVWSYKDTMVWKAAGEASWDSVLFFWTRSLGWSRLYR